MKVPTLFLLLIVTITISVASYADESGNDLNMPSHDFTLSETAETSTSLRGPSRFLAQQKLPANYTCNKFPRVCRLKGSAGPDCCKKKCVNVKTDRLNCGMCGYKCKYTEICCRGSCVNASFDKRHCGGCNKRCRKGEFCVYGMCNYA